MAVLLFRLNQVPEDEADEVRQLLNDARIDYYESSAGFFGLGVAAIWLSDNTDLPHARELIENYQAQRSEQMRADYQARLNAGEEPGFWQQSLQHPVRLISTVALLVLILAVIMLPFWKTLHP